jgi:hypothetical protein
VYYAAWKKHCPLGSRRVLLPLIFFIDKTFFDKKGKLNSEPITFTLGILKRLIRNNNPNAWRAIGLIADAFMSTYHEALDKAKDYHHMLSLIFAELREMQLSDGFSWKIDYNGTHEVIFVPVIHLIITDTKAADDMVGKIQFRGTTIDQLPKHMCRFCDTPGDLIDDTVHRYNLTSSLDIKTLYETRPTEELTDICYRPLYNAFWDLQMSDPLGINGSMPPDALHVMLKGTHMYLRECFFDLLRLEGSTRRQQALEQTAHENAASAPPQPRASKQKKKQTRKRNHKKPRTKNTSARSTAGDNATVGRSVVVGALSEGQLGKYRIFTKKSKPPFEAIAWALAKQIKRQSDRDMPRTHFAQGVTQNFAKLNGSEETGVLLIILLSMCSSAGSTMFAAHTNVTTFMGVERYSKWIGTLERFLLLEQ